MTVRCTIRRARPDDAELLVAWRAQPSVRQYQPIMQVGVPETRRILERRGRDALDSRFDDKAMWIVEADGIPAGWVSLTVVHRQQAIGNVGYTIGEGFRGQKLAGRALRQVCDIAFAPDGLALERLEANCTVTNIASAKTLEYAGFRQEGIARGHLRIDGVRVDHFRYGRLATDPPPTP